MQPRLEPCKHLALRAVGIWISKSHEHFFLRGFHLGRVRGVLVIEAQQVKCAMNHHVSPMRFVRLTLLAGLALDNVSAYNEITERRFGVHLDQIGIGFESEHVGRTLALAILAIELRGFRLANEPDIQLPGSVAV